MKLTINNLKFHWINLWLKFVNSLRLKNYKIWPESSSGCPKKFLDFLAPYAPSTPLKFQPQLQARKLLQKMMLTSLRYTIQSHRQDFSSGIMYIFQFFPEISPKLPFSILQPKYSMHNSAFTRLFPGTKIWRRCCQWSRWKTIKD